MSPPPAWTRTCGACFGRSWWRSVPKGRPSFFARTIWRKPNGFATESPSSRTAGSWTSIRPKGSSPSTSPARKWRRKCGPAWCGKGGPTWRMSTSNSPAAAWGWRAYDPRIPVEHRVRLAPVPDGLPQRPALLPADDLPGADLLARFLRVGSGGAGGGHHHRGPAPDLPQLYFFRHPGPDRALPGILRRGLRRLRAHVLPENLPVHRHYAHHPVGSALGRTAVGHHQGHGGRRGGGPDRGRDGGFPSPLPFDHPALHLRRGLPFLGHGAGFGGFCPYHRRTVLPPVPAHLPHVPFLRRLLPHRQPAGPLAEDRLVFPADLGQFHFPVPDPGAALGSPGPAAPGALAGGDGLGFPQVHVQTAGQVIPNTRISGLFYSPFFNRFQKGGT